MKHNVECTNKVIFDTTCVKFKREQKYSYPVSGCIDLKQECKNMNVESISPAYDIPVASHNFKMNTKIFTVDPKTLHDLISANISGIVKYYISPSCVCSSLARLLSHI